MVDQIALQRRMSACFNGTVRRECSTCPGHHTQTGRCCFGARFDPDDTDECGECRHQVDCELETRRYGEIRIGSPRPYQSIAPTTTISSVPSPIRNSARIPIGAEPVMETPFERFMKDAIWEAFKGFFSGALGFFNNYRWR